VRRTAFLLSGALLAVACVLVFRTQAKLASSGSRPVIKVDWDSTKKVPILTLDAEADGLTINDRLFANVLAYPGDRRDEARHVFVNYYSGFTGPSVTGHAEQRVAVPVPLTDREKIRGAWTTVPIKSVLVAAIVEKQQDIPLIKPGHFVGITCEGEVYASDNGRKVSEDQSHERPDARRTKPACIYLQATAPPTTAPTTTTPTDTTSTSAITPSPAPPAATTPAP
jgi:hypothetical protein